MIRVIATVAMNFGLIYAPNGLSQLPKGQTLIVGAKMAKKLGTPFKGQNCLVLDAAGVKGWGRTDFIPHNCIVLGGHNTLTQGLGMADAVTLIVRPVSSAGRRLDLIDFEEVSRVPIADGAIVIEYRRMV